MNDADKLRKNIKEGKDLRQSITEMVKAVAQKVDQERQDKRVQSNPNR